jgi:hypothetical protein
MCRTFFSCFESKIGRLLIWAVFDMITEVSSPSFCASLSHGRRQLCISVVHSYLCKNGWASILSVFSKTHLATLFESEASKFQSA